MCHSLVCDMYQIILKRLSKELFGDISACAYLFPACRAGGVYQAVDETQERLEMLGGELDDMCRRLGMGNSFQVWSHFVFAVVHTYIHT